MKTTLKNLLAAASLVFLISSCGGGKADILIPESAALVVHINGKSLGSKMTMADLRNADWFKKLERMAPMGKDEKKFLDNPSEFGIDLNNDMYVFVQPSGNNAYFSFQCILKDAKAFENNLKKYAEGVKIKTDGGISYVGEDDAMLTWKGNRLMMFGNASGFNSAFGGRRSSDNINEDSILAFAKKVYNITSGGSIGSNDKFKNLMAETGDIHFFMDNGYINGASMQGMLGLTKAASLFEGNTSTFTLNFEDGKITGTTKSYYNKELEALYKKMQNGNINEDMLKKIPGTNVSAVMALNFKPEFITEFMKKMGVEGMAESFLSKEGFSLADITKACKGDMLVALTDFSVKEEMKESEYGGMYPKKTTDAKFLVAASINDQSAFDKVWGTLNEKANKDPEGAEAFAKFKHTIKDSWFIGANSQETVDAYNSGTATNHDFISKIKGHPMAIFIDIKKILGSIQTKDMAGYFRMFGTDAGGWENLLFYGGEMKDGAQVGYMEINMTDKKRNSLKQLVDFFGNMATMFLGAFEGESDMSDFDYPAGDTTIPAPPAVEVKPAN